MNSYLSTTLCSSFFYSSRKTSFEMFLAGARSFCHKDREPSISLIAAQAFFRIRIIQNSVTDIGLWNNSKRIWITFIALVQVSYKNAVKQMLLLLLLIAASFKQSFFMQNGYFRMSLHVFMVQLLLTGSKWGHFFNYLHLMYKFISLKKAFYRGVVILW